MNALSEAKLFPNVADIHKVTKVTREKLPVRTDKFETTWTTTKLASVNAAPQTLKPMPKAPVFGADAANVWQGGKAPYQYQKGKGLRNERDLVPQALQDEAESLAPRKMSVPAKRELCARIYAAVEKNDTDRIFKIWRNLTDTNHLVGYPYASPRMQIMRWADLNQPKETKPERLKREKAEAEAAAKRIAQLKRGNNTIVVTKEDIAAHRAAMAKRGK